MLKYSKIFLFAHFLNLTLKNIVFLDIMMMYKNSSSVSVCEILLCKMKKSKRLRS